MMDKRFYEAIRGIRVLQDWDRTGLSHIDQDWLSTIISGLTKRINPLRKVLKSIHYAKEGLSVKRSRVQLN